MLKAGARPQSGHKSVQRLCLICVLVLLGLPGLNASAGAAPFTLRDDRGVEHRFDAPPQRIVTLLPSLTESLAVLGGSPRLVGVDRYSNWPPELAALPRLGGLDDALIEAIATLKPDVVLASTSARSIDRLEALGFKVLRLKSETHADVRRTLSLLAQMLGTPDEGERVWARLQREINAAALRVPHALKGQRVYFEIGGGPYAAGRSSFIGETLTALGMDNIVPAVLGPFPKLNPEYVVRARPDLVMGVAREQAALLSRPGWGSIPALANKRLCAFDSPRYEMLIRPGPRLGEAAAVMADCLVALERR
jgi:iron complex transport system substrate-binding protein